ncbi:LysR family transcriptional regulator [Sphingomonas cavernae]|uniref:LysR family transcriptional regulator n=1 Tax=Sphingomonas cavernae TaxID=2320861 RepID=A0A418WKV8_9SPHN|nr:LysR family transcriptional regulator [Sphingomonas cavernae]RJF90663.1 LysR family transcriptional regulator [Sphingomonas cavernae]
MDRLQALEALVAVADHGGFAAGARAIRMSPPAMTRIIAALEAHLGVALFHRSTRAVTLTEEGAAFLASSRRVLDDLRTAELAAMGGQDAPQGMLIVTAPVAFGQRHVVPVTNALLSAHPRLAIRLLLIDRNVRIVEEGIDVAVRIGPLADSSLVARKIGEVARVAVASAGYLAEHGAPADPQELKRHALIGVTAVNPATEWRFGAKGEVGVAIRPRLLVNTNDAAIQAAEAGIGIAYQLSYQVDEAIAAGRLAPVLTEYWRGPIPVHLVFGASRAGTPAVRAFADAMQARAVEVLHNAQTRSS